MDINGKLSIAIVDDWMVSGSRISTPMISVNKMAIKTHRHVALRVVLKISKIHIVIIYSYMSYDLQVCTCLSYTYIYLYT